MQVCLKEFTTKAWTQTCVCVAVSCVKLFCGPWIVNQQAPLSMGFSRQECCSGLPFPTPGHLPNSGIQSRSPVSPALQANSLPRSRQRSPRSSKEVSRRKKSEPRWCNTWDSEREVSRRKGRSAGLQQEKWPLVWRLGGLKSP